nr:uncharacterized protein LOC105861058 [Microcebus murinus]
MAAGMSCACSTFPGREEQAQEEPGLGVPSPHLGCVGHFTSPPSSSVSPSVNLEWRQLPSWVDLGGTCSPLLAVPCLQPRIGGKGSGLGPCRGLHGQVVLSPGVTWPQWTWVTCRLCVWEASPARGQQRVREQEALGMAGACPCQGLVQGKGRRGPGAPDKGNPGAQRPGSPGQATRDLVLVTLCSPPGQPHLASHGRCLPLQAGSWSGCSSARAAEAALDPGPLGAPSPEPCSRPLSSRLSCGVLCIAAAAAPCVDLSPPRDWPSGRRGETRRVVSAHIPPQGLPSPGEASLSVVDKTRAVTCRVPMFVCENKGQSPPWFLDSHLGRLKTSQILNKSPEQEEHSLAGPRMLGREHVQTRGLASGPPFLRTEGEGHGCVPDVSGSLVFLT